MLAVWPGVHDGPVFYQIGQKGCTAAIRVSQIFFISLRKKKKKYESLDFKDNTHFLKKVFSGKILPELIKM